MLILIGDQGTGDLDIRYMGQHVGIAQLPGEVHNVAGILALFVNILDLLQAVIHIFMEETDGLEIGGEIRRRFPETELVFVSVSREFGPEAIDLDALYYLVKPYRRGLLFKIKKRFHRIHMPQLEVYDADIRQNQKIPYRRIVYIESIHNYLYIHLATEAVVRVRGSLQEVMKNLDERFLRINRGVIVNMEAVDRMNTDSCEVGGMIFMLSRRQRADSRRKYNDYIFRHYMEE